MEIGLLALGVGGTVGLMGAQAVVDVDFATAASHAADLAAQAGAGRAYPEWRKA